ncbi:MAG TPA: WcaF family extracellular polysaccharide biosynthesis acetyltransferase [Nitrospira sp.]
MEIGSSERASKIWVRAREASPFTVRKRIIVGLWWLVQATLFRMSPHPMHAWRRSLLRLFGAKMGAGSGVHASVKVWFPGNLSIGEHSGIGFDSVIYNLDKVEIDDFVSVAQRVHLNTGTHDYSDPAFTLVAKPIVIKSGAFIGTDTYVGPGVVIGEMAVIGARSVVTKSMPAEMVCYGHPCRPIKPREKKDNAVFSCNQKPGPQ